jgi:hypothetical protein
MSEKECPTCPPPVECKDFKLECVIVCDKYDDFLLKTLPTNKFLFDKIVIVTSPDDKKTQKVCEYLHVECVVTDRLESRWGRFRKGCGINDGLEKLDKDGFVVHMDADIYLPPQTRILLKNMNLDKQMIYGIDRFIVKGAEAWERFVSEPKLQHEDGAWVHPNAFPLGTRVMHPHVGGYIPIGFFQLWHPLKSGIDKYLEGHTNAGREDAAFAGLWPRHKRAMLPEIIGYHLESNDSTIAANWNGRTTAPFTVVK